jgi:hypothetical protein
MSLKDVMGRYRGVYRTTSGAKFFGEIFQPPLLDNPNRMEEPRMFLKLHPNVTGVAAGTLIQAQGKVYLVCENASSDREEVIYNTFKLIRMTQQLAWKRQQESTDPVTGLKRSYNVETDLGTIWCGIEPDRMVSDRKGIDSEQYMLFTNASLRPGDLVGKYTVQTADVVLGVMQARVL